MQNRYIIVFRYGDGKRKDKFVGITALSSAQAKSLAWTKTLTWNKFENEELSKSGDKNHWNIISVYIDTDCELTRACNDLLNAPHYEHFSVRLNEKENEAFERMKKALEAI